MGSRLSTQDPQLHCCYKRKRRCIGNNQVMGNLQNIGRTDIFGNTKKLEMMENWEGRWRMNKRGSQEAGRERIRSGWEAKAPFPLEQKWERERKSVKTKVLVALRNHFLEGFFAYDEEGTLQSSESQEAVGGIEGDRLNRAICGWEKVQEGWSPHVRCVQTAFWWVYIFKNSKSS